MYIGWTIIILAIIILNIRIVCDTGKGTYEILLANLILHSFALHMVIIVELDYEALNNRSWATFVDFLDLY